MPEKITLNRSNIVNGSNNTQLEFKFPTTTELKDKVISVEYLSLYNSWYNIDYGLYNNNSFQYKWWDTSGNLTQIYTISFPDGYFSIDTIQTYIEVEMNKKGHYVTVAEKTYYFFKLIDNPTFYSIDIELTPMYSTSQIPNSGILKGSNTWNFPATPQCIQVIINSTNNFGKLIGFSPNSYPSNVVSTKPVLRSNITPQLDPISSIVMRCSMIKNNLSTPNDVLITFSSGNASFGDLVEIKPNYQSTSNIANSTYDTFKITLTDQSYGQIKIIDPDILITLVIDEKK